MDESSPPVQIAASGVDTLDAGGQLPLHLRLAETQLGRPSRATLEATVVDVNRQTVSASASVLVHPADFYVGAKPEERATSGPPGRRSPWRHRGQARRHPAARREGRRHGGPPGVALGAARSRGLRRAGGGMGVGHRGDLRVTTAAEPVPCGFTPPAGGSYTVSFRAQDAAGRVVSTSFYRWATGKDWVPWNDESQFKMDVIPDRTRYTVGDTATVLFASPFTDAEAWITVEREGLLQQRRLTIRSGTTTLKLPITEALAPTPSSRSSWRAGGARRPGRSTTRAAPPSGSATPSCG